MDTSDSVYNGNDILTLSFLQANKWTLSLSGEVIAVQTDDDVRLLPTYVSSWEYVSEGIQVIIGYFICVLDFTLLVFSFNCPV